MFLSGKKRLKKILLATTVIIVIAKLLLDHHTIRSMPEKKTPNDDFYYSLVNHLKTYKPIALEETSIENKKNLRTKNCKMADMSLFDDRVNNLAVYNNLNECYSLPDSIFDNLESNHWGFVNKIKTDLQKKYHHPSSSSKKTKEKDDNESDIGIVTVGGGKYSVLAYNSIRSMRKFGTTLPVEVFIPEVDKVGEEDFCFNVLPKLNAKCIFLSDVLPDSLLEDPDFKFDRFQFKVWALLISTFRHVAFIDADNYLISNLDDFNNQTSYLENGLVIWPDMWARVTPPTFYKLIHKHIDLNENPIRNVGDSITPFEIQYPEYKDNRMTYDDAANKIRMHNFKNTLSDPTSESGQMLMDKVRHLDTLLLSLYYNVYGPAWYYNMFSLGGAGEGDKETFIGAAFALDNPYYQIKSGMGITGFFKQKKEGGNGEYRGCGLLQVDFEKDYQHYYNYVRKNSEKLVQDDLFGNDDNDPIKKYNKGRIFYDKWMKDENNGKNLEYMFVHASLNKFDPWRLYKDREFAYDRDGVTPYRQFRDLKRMKYFDIELFAFEELEKVMCHDEQRIDFKYYQDKKNTDDWPKICLELSKRVEFLKETHDSAVKPEI
ncbi:related to Alpha-1,2-mannosyltransferase MNN5 [Saccharomycodes ludwigii]|uniref:Related to Alpha-1,2-mannosyltransferase MNN5 n=1 Tax=Saccharomycodes ludwigii TaxID=36035 RepID=A0A376B3A9_9ASCO|nr:related to Alpha-1,2-mannosyltransferase MNN5 [Saccharomycodes ludwigii]